ncbi:MBL fold metallo-hydrolase [Boseaceae bacterium BT-24-1]|nr:MBL fold metallo-hydrolase [Boseaceae bacterium BT-24-1]
MTRLVDKAVSDQRSPTSQSGERDTRTLSGTWFDRTRYHPAITRIWEPRVHRMFRGNTWLIEGRDADLVIDFGLGVTSLTNALDRDVGKPVIALATHVHVDHVGCLHEFEDRLGHGSEAAYFQRMPDEFTLAHLVRTTPDAAGEEPPAGWKCEDFELRPAPLTRIVADGDVIDLGDTFFRVVHLPGHSAGSIGVLDEARKLLFSGDAIYEGRLLDGFPGSSVDDYVGTMRRLISMNVETVFGGHGEPISGGRMKAIAAGYIADREAGGREPFVPSIA